MADREAHRRNSCHMNKGTENGAKRLRLGRKTSGVTAQAHKRNSEQKRKLSRERNMRLRKRSTGSRVRVRADDYVELPRNYRDKVVYDACGTTEALGQVAVRAADAEGAVWGSEASSDFEFDMSMPSTDEEDGEEHEPWQGEGPGEAAAEDGSAIPELDLNELIVLANQLVRNSPPSVTNGGRVGSGRSSVANVHIRFPLIRTIHEARDVIMQYERLSGGRAGTGAGGEAGEGAGEGGDGAETTAGDRAGRDGEVVWDSIVQDYSGISISGTRAYEAAAAAAAGADEAGENVNVNVNLDNNVNLENMHRQPVWLELAGLATVTMFMFAVYRLVTNLVSISAFSENVVGDVVGFVEYINDKTYYKHVSHPTDHTSLIYKFGLIIKREMPYLPDTVWLVLTVVAFSAYTVLTSGVVLTSMLFATMCLTMCVVLRWRHLGDFILRVVDNGERCL